MSDRALGVSLIFVLILAFSVVIPQQTNAQFVLASWDYPDEYGQGIVYVAVYDNTTWLVNLLYNGSSSFEISAEMNLTLAVFVWLNGTETGIGLSEDGREIIRHNITVTTPYETVFSQDGFTFNVDTGESNAPMYFYRYDVWLNFTFVASLTYTAIVTYEILMVV